MTRACWTASICAASTSSVGSTADSKPCSDGRAVRLQVPNTTIKRCQVPPTFLAYSKSRSRAAHQRVRLGAVCRRVGQRSSCGLGNRGVSFVDPWNRPNSHPACRPCCTAISYSTLLSAIRRSGGLRVRSRPDGPPWYTDDVQDRLQPARCRGRWQDSRPCQAVDHARRNQMHFRGQPGPELAERLAWHIPFDPRPSRLAHERRAGGTHACGQAADSCQPTNHI